MKINITIPENSEFKESVLVAVNCLNACNSEFYFHLSERDIFFKGWLIKPLVEMPELKRKYGDEESFDVFIVENKFTDNYFSHDSKNTSIISIDNWDVDFAPPPLHTYLAYQLTQAAVFFAARYTWRAGHVVSHKESIGCCFDHCYDKAEIKFGLAAGMLCFTCEGNLRQYGVDEEIILSIRQMLEQVRGFAIGQPKRIMANKVFLVQRFSEYDENSNAMKYGVVSALEEMNIDGIRADEDRGTGFLLDKIRKEIDTSSAVIAKVDSRNLNVYFELGYAAALGKPVFIICEESLISDLPTDIKGWGLISYKQGNYDGLKKNVKKSLSSIARFSDRLPQK